MDEREIRVRRVEMRLEQLRHQVGLRHSDLQRRFLFALTLAGGVFLSLLRAEVPAWGALAAVPPLGWAAWELHRIGHLARDADEAANHLIGTLDEGNVRPQVSRSPEGNEA